MSASQVVLTPKRGLVAKPPKPKPSHNVPKKPEVVLVEIDCMCCRRPFGSWDRKLNRLCRTCTENG